jgi:hypothetical protein
MMEAPAAKTVTSRTLRLPARVAAVTRTSIKGCDQLQKIVLNMANCTLVYCISLRKTLYTTGCYRTDVLIQ